MENRIIETNILELPINLLTHTICILYFLATVMQGAKSMGGNIFMQL